MRISARAWLGSELCRREAVSHGVFMTQIRIGSNLHRAESGGLMGLGYAGWNGPHPEIAGKLHLYWGCFWFLILGRPER